MFSWDWCSCQITRDKWNGTVCITACVLQLSLALAITNQCFVCTACYTSKLLEIEQNILVISFCTFNYIEKKNRVLVLSTLKIIYFSNE